MVGELTRDIKYSQGHDESILGPSRAADIFSRTHFLAKCLMHVLQLQALQHHLLDLRNTIFVNLPVIIV